MVMCLLVEMGDVLFVEVLLFMGCCVGGVWCCCCELIGCVNGASPFGSVLSLFYQCAFRLIQSVLCVWLHLIEVYCFLTKVIKPND